MDVSLVGRAEGQQKMEGSTAAVSRRPLVGRRFGWACQWALGENIFFAMGTILGLVPLLNKQVALRRAMLWYSVAGAAAGVVAVELVRRGRSRRSTACCRGAAFAALASAAFSHCMVCGFCVRFVLTRQGEPFLVAAVAFVVVYYAVYDVLGFLDILRCGDDGVTGGGEKEE